VEGWVGAMDTNHVDSQAFQFLLLGDVYFVCIVLIF
jgi:hypothetical protein